MCTLTLTPFSKRSNAFIFTSNRDEAVGRRTSAPEIHFFKSKKMLFPKDEEAGGTWIGLSETKRCVCLLNGAFKPHKREKSYKMSRGIVVKELLAVDDLNTFVENFNFTGIEPFTAVIVEFLNKLLFKELVWDGKKMFFRQLPLVSHIWSSAPLYSEEMKEERKSWFFHFEKTTPVHQDSLWDFHHNAGTGDKTKDLIIDRGFLKTKSITQIVHSQTGTTMKYEDLEKSVISKNQFD